MRRTSICGALETLLINEKISFVLIECIRDEEKFDNSDQLVRQLHQDRKYCMELKKKYE